MHSGPEDDAAAPIRGGLPKYGTARPWLPSIDNHRPEPVKGKPALAGTRPARATRRTQPTRTPGKEKTPDQKRWNR